MDVRNHHRTPSDLRRRHERARHRRRQNRFDRRRDSGSPRGTLHKALERRGPLHRRRARRSATKRPADRPSGAPCDDLHRHRTRLPRSSGLRDWRERRGPLRGTFRHPRDRRPGRTVAVQRERRRHANARVSSGAERRPRDPDPRSHPLARSERRTRLRERRTGCVLLSRRTGKRLSRVRHVARARGRSSDRARASVHDNGHAGALLRRVRSFPVDAIWRRIRRSRRRPRRRRWREPHVRSSFVARGRVLGRRPRRTVLGLGTQWRSDTHRRGSGTRPIHFRLRRRSSQLRAG
jgi:hypothetical protein